MLVLALDTSSPTVTVAVCEGMRLISERAETANNKHCERLAPLINLALSDAGLGPSALDGIVVGLGPAPFTGLRVGIMTARAMGDALGIPVWGRCSLDGIASRYANGERPFAVLTDARRKQVYWARYDAQTQRVEGPELGRAEDVAALLASHVTHVVGAGVDLYPAAFAGFSKHADDPSPRAVNLLWGADLSAPPGDLEPLYLRRPDAQPPGKPKAVTPA